MGKSSGATRNSSASAPKGINQIVGGSLKDIRAQIETAKQNGATWANPELVRLRINEEKAMKQELEALAGKNGWNKGFQNLTKEYDNDSPVMLMQVSVTSYGSGIEDGPYYQARVGGSRVSSNSEYVDEINSLWNNDMRFKTAAEAIKWADTQAKKINKKYKGKI